MHRPRPRDGRRAEGRAESLPRGHHRYPDPLHGPMGTGPYVTPPRRTRSVSHGNGPGTGHCASPAAWATGPGPTQTSESRPTSWMEVTWWKHLQMGTASEDGNDLGGGGGMHKQEGG